MALETVYWVALGVGVLFLLLSTYLGDVVDFLDFLDFDIGDGFSVTPVFFTALAGFGGGGLLALQAFELSPGASAMAGLATSVVLGGLAALFFVLLHRQEATEGFTRAGLVGARGRCVLAIHPGAEGRVSVTWEGMTRSLSARSDDTIVAGDEVVVVDVLGDVLKVAKAGA